MTAPTEELFRDAYARWGRNHETLREELMARIATLPSARRSRRHWFPAVAVVLVAVVGSSATYVATRPTPAYGVEGARQRMQSLRSLYLKGTMYQRETTDFGVALVRFPFERYYERPGRYYADSYGFSSRGNDDLTNVSKVTIAYDDDRVMAIQHDAKQAIVGRNPDLLQTELMVETGLQISEVEQLLGGVPQDYVRVGTEKIGDAWCDLYEIVRNEGAMRFTKRVWIDPDTGLPARVLLSSARQGETPEPVYECTEIRADAAPPERLFAFQVPEGYETVEGTNADAPETPEQPPIGAFSSGTAGAHTVAQWVGVNIDDRAVLACWSQWSVDGDGKAWFTIAPKIELVGATSRACVEQPLWETTSGDVRWRWSLIRPADGRSLAGDELMFEVRDLQDGTMTLTVHPLAFPESRLAEIVAAVQRRSLADEGEANQVLSIDELRRKIAE